MRICAHITILVVDLVSNGKLLHEDNPLHVVQLWFCVVIGSKHIEGSKVFERAIYLENHNMEIFGVTPFIKLQKRHLNES